jgi:hypothetical protein
MAGKDQQQPSEPEMQGDGVDLPPIGETGTRYVVFDPDTGRIVGTYGMLDAESGEYREQSEEDVRAIFGSPEPGAAEAGAASALEVLKLDAREAVSSVSSAELRVDPSEGRLIPRPRIQLAADRDSITGDGEDSTQITITVTDAAGVRDQGFAGEVRASTTHGRLSEPGGRVTLRDGAATITLTSTPETIDRIRVTVRDTQRLAVTGEVELEFL